MSRHLPRALWGSAEVPRVLSNRAARALGLSRSAQDHAVAAKGWQRLARGFLLTAPGPPTRADWINVGLELAGPSGALSGWDAVRIVGLGATTPPHPAVLILCRGGENRTVGGVHIRPTERPFSSWTLPADHPDLPFAEVVQASRAVADTALLYRRFAPVRALVTSAVQKNVCDVADLVAELANGPRNNSGHLRRATADLLDGARSIAEAETIDVLRRSPVPEFEANVPIVTVSGTWLATADVLWRELRAILEIDSREFHFSEADWQLTMARHNLLSRYGLAIDHYPPSMIRDRPMQFAKEIEVWLHARARELQVPYVIAPSPLRRTSGGPRPFVVADLP